jgi:serine phosphatase RsbU (regulator of sigma subunit)
LSLGTAATVEYVLRRRRLAEDLAAENERLYVEQRDIAGTLQHALLPTLPNLPSLEIAARYLPGVAGIEVGGDWYDVVPCDEQRCFFVVGDVSGRGLGAATTMASLRFATRAYVAQGDRPVEVLTKLNSLLDFDSTQRFATVLIGEVDLAAGQLNLANAGHLPPLLLQGGGHRFLEVPPGSPIGIDGAPPGTLTVDLAPGSTVLAYTDGLVERRREHLEEGLNRLVQTFVAQDGPVGLDTVLDRLTAQMVPGGADDDTVLLGLRWRK